MVEQDDSGQRIPIALWDYRTTCKSLTKFTPFQWVYEKEPMILVEFFAPRLCIALAKNMSTDQSIQSRLNELMELEEDIILVGFNQQVEKNRKKAWHDRNIRKRKLDPSLLVLLNGSRYIKLPGKMQIRWMRPFRIAYITKSSVVNLHTLWGDPLKGMVNGRKLESYYKYQGSNE